MWYWAPEIFVLRWLQRHWDFDGFEHWQNQGAGGFPSPLGSPSCENGIGVPEAGFWALRPNLAEQWCGFGGPPLPLPLPVDSESGNRSLALTSAPQLFQEMKQGSWRLYASELRPLPCPKDQLAMFWAFCREELVGACQNFLLDLLCREVVVGPVYRCFLGNITDVDITWITSEPPQSVRKWIVELKSVAHLWHPHLFDVLGFYVCISAPDSNPRLSSGQLVVYAGMHNDSLDQPLYGRTSDKQPLDWPSRLKIAFGAAQGLTFLHEISSV